MSKLFLLIFLLLCSFLSQANAQRKHRRTRGRSWSSTTTLIRRHHRPGELIFSEEFHTLDGNVWEHEIAKAGRTNGEFQEYVDDPNVSYVRDGIFYIKPTIIENNFGRENEMIKSARINTRSSFGFRYGHIEVRAKLPEGDWIWPAIWLMPQANKFGMWPQSGEIDLMESRGNRNLFSASGEDIGCNQFGSTLHFGINRTTDKWRLAHFKKTDFTGFNTKFHNYGMLWTPDQFIFTLDDEIIGRVEPPQGGFWEMGNFTGPKLWEDDKMSPFNQPFYVILNVAVGGTSGYFQENTVPQKPWKNGSPKAREEFLKARSEWEPTWVGEESAMQIDYIRIWAI